MLALVAVLLVGAEIDAVWWRGPRHRHGAIPQCMNRLGSLAPALQKYRQDVGTYPAALSELYPRYVQDPALLRCFQPPSPPYRLQVLADGRTVVTCTNHRHSVFQDHPALLVTVTTYTYEQITLTPDDGQVTVRAAATPVRKAVRPIWAPDVP